MKKIILFLLLALTIPYTNADIFIPQKNYNTYTKEKHIQECWIKDELKTTKYCEIPVDSEEFKKRLELVNWYTDFDIIMREKMYSEMIWDIWYDYVDYISKWEKNYPWRESAYAKLTQYTESYDSWATWYLRDHSDSEESFRDEVRSNLFATLSSLEKSLIWYNLIDIQRKNLIKIWLIEESDEYQTIYLGNIDEIEKLFKENGYKNLDDWFKEKYNNIYFPNVRKYLELEKEWVTFYRTFENWSEESYKRQWYSSEEILKAKKWEYTNSYYNKVNFEFTIKQEIGKNILNDSPIKINKKTKLENYAEKWWKDIEKDSLAVQNIFKKYFQKYKKKNWVTQEKINKKVELLKGRVWELVQTYENKYKIASTPSKKSKYKKYVWILLIAEKVLNENSF